MLTLHFLCACDRTLVGYRYCLWQRVSPIDMRLKLSDEFDWIGFHFFHLMRRKEVEIFSSPVNRWNVIFSGSFNPNRNSLIGIVCCVRVRGFLFAEYSLVL